MGYLRHKALLVNGWDRDRVTACQREVQLLYARASQIGEDFVLLVSPVVGHIVNGGASFFVAPDGSKEGWATSDRGDDLLSEAKAIIRGHKFVDFCEVLCGGDDDEFAILDSSAQAIEAPQDTPRKASHAD